MNLRSNREGTLKSFFLERMKKYRIESVMVTIINLERRGLKTKEAMEEYCKGKKDSVNEDLESFFEDLRLGKDPVKYAETYSLPKLAKEEMKLVERKDISYLKTFQWLDPDVGEIEMKLSESDSKFVFGLGWRITFTIENKSSQNNSNCCNLQ